MKLPAVMPKAWMGYSAKPIGGNLTVRVCCKCPDKDAADALAKSLGCAASHGYCPECYATYMRQLGLDGNDLSADGSELQA